MGFSAAKIAPPPPYTPPGTIKTRKGFVPQFAIAALLSAIDKRGVRLDAYLDDGKTIYNIEMQTAEYGALPQRARLYQAHIDINQLERGQNFDELRPSYVIFICTFDPFGQSWYQYSFRHVCRETGEELQDEAYKLFFNTTGTKGEISPSLREMLQYINNPGAYPVQKLSLIHICSPM